MYPQIFGKYVLEREIAAGGMARVYLATLRGAVGFEKRLVVKQIRSELALDDAFVRRFVEEAKTAVELNHPNIVPVYELGVEQGVYYIAMEQCRGVSLSELLEAGPLEPDQGAYVGAEICRALDYAHRRTGLVHRDVTPRNVMIDEEGAVRLIDFGIAAPAAPDGSVEIRQREVFGSPGHMPPEQLEGRPLTPAADVFAVATLLIEVWTGRPPFRRATLQASSDALKVSPAKLSEHDPRFAPISDVIARAVDFDPKQRPQNAELLGRSLREFAKTRDRGDLARELGERVRRAGQSRHGSRESITNPALPQTPVMSQLPEQSKPIESRTFAARSELVQWTRPVPLPAPELEPTTTPTEHAAERRSYWPKLTRRRLIWGTAASSVVLLLPLLGGLLQSAPVSTLGTVGPRVLAATPLPAPRVLATVDPRPSPVAPARVPNLAPAASKPSAAEKSVLVLSSDLPASASVDGQAFAAVPRSLELRPGEYKVEFKSSGLEERVRTTVTLAAGDRVRMHADFSSAAPRIVVR